MKHFLIIIFSIITIAFGLSSIVYAATNIDPNYPNYYAWNDKIGWIDFKTSGTVNVASNFIDGYANFGTSGGPYGYLSFNCLTGPSGSNCSPVNYNVTNDGSGNMSGWAWSDSIGWVSFDCHNPETGGAAPDYSCGASPYQVKINTSSGEMSGYAWNDVLGWISFSCSNDSTCGTVDYRVKTTWIAGSAKASVTSGTFDTGRATGVAFNYLIWRGSLNGGKVSFQFATSNTDSGWGAASGDGAFLGPGGTTIATDVYTSVDADIPVKLVNQSTHNNKRYFRYKVYLETDASRSATPIVQDVIVNWSP